MEKIRILRIIARLNVGGPSIQSAILTGALNDHEFQSKLIAGDLAAGEASMDSVLEAYKVKPVFLNELSREISLFKDIKAISKICGIIKRYRPHIVHTHTSKAGFVGRIAAFLTGVPVKVHTFHGHTFHSYFGALKAFIFLNTERVLSFFTDKIITISRLQYEDICHNYKVALGSKCMILPLGIGLDAFLDLPIGRKDKARIGFNEKDIVIGIVGRLTDIKNHELFIKAAKIIKNKLANIKFAIVGDGENKDKIRTMADELNISGSVKFFGWQEHMSDFYGGFDVLALTSKNEGTPVSVIEAMASGVPVVATAVGGVPDLVENGKTGTLVTENSPDRFASELIKIIEDENKRFAYGRNAREIVRTTYNKERLISDIKQLYRDLIKEKGVSL